MQKKSTLNAIIITTTIATTLHKLSKHWTTKLIDWNRYKLTPKTLNVQNIRVIINREIRLIFSSQFIRQQQQQEES